MGDEDTKELRRQVGGELRAVIDTLLSRRAPEAGLHRALELLGEVRDQLGGPEVAPYNSAPGFWSGDTGGGWDSYIDVSVFGGGVNPLGTPMDLYWGTDDEGRYFADGTVSLGRPYEGGPGMVHGGYVAGLIDHMFGAAMHAGPVTAVTATLTVRYLAPTPIDRPLHLRAWFDKASGRRLVGRATCHHGDVLTAEAEGLFIRVDMAEMAERVRGA
ncbi:MAG TPA: PaaI family thioesterase [Acidimicrobiales bacterium]|nr:PaaI family thioesterase [Acidimicrobiales bacterium]